MRILVHDSAGHPFQAQLSRELARRGHVVMHSYLAKQGGRSGALERLPSDPKDLVFHPIVLDRPAGPPNGVLRRLRHELAYGRATADVVAKFRPDVVVSSNTPLVVQRLFLRAARRNGSKFVFWMQDRVSVSQARKVRRRFGIIGLPAATILRRLERSSLVGSDAVVAVSPAFEEPLREADVAADRVAVIPNWAPLDEIVPVARDNDWASEHGLTSKLVYMYAGSLGLKHDPASLVDLAQAIPEAMVVVIAQGSGASLVESEAARLGLTNVLVLPSQPYERLSDVLGAADVLLAILDRQGGVYSVPSKVLSYLCAERPVLASVPHANLAAQVIVDSGGGIVVEPGQKDDWLRAAGELARDEQLRAALARNGRDYAERTFDIGRIADEFEAVIGRARAGPNDT